MPQIEMRHNHLSSVRVKSIKNIPFLCRYDIVFDKQTIPSASYKYWTNTRVSYQHQPQQRQLKMQIEAISTFYYPHNPFICSLFRLKLEHLGCKTGKTLKLCPFIITLFYFTFRF